MENKNNTTIKNQLKAYKRKFYANKVIRGLIFFTSVLLIALTLASLVEFSFRLPSAGRTVLFFSLVLTFLSLLIFWIVMPLMKYVKSDSALSDEEAARQIGSYFPDIKDRLLNYVQLEKSINQGSELLKASLQQRIDHLKIFNLKEVISFNTNVPYLKYVIAPALVIIVIFISLPEFFSKSTARIIQYNQEFEEERPFYFSLVNQDLQAFKNEDYEVNLRLLGEAMPENVYLKTRDRRIKMKNIAADTFSHKLSNLQNSLSISFEAAGFESKDYKINVVNRPNIKNFTILLDYPAYLGKENQRLNNIGNLEVPEGTRVTWSFKTFQTDSLWMNFADTTYASGERTEEGVYTLQKRVFKTEKYEINLKNAYSLNKDKIQYYLNVIKDEYPDIQVEQYKDTTLYQFLALGGNVSDDYGLSKLEIKYSEIDQNSEYKSLPVKLQGNQLSQSFYYEWNFDSLDLKPGEGIRYYLQVWDNDGINGSKSTKSPIFTFQVPSKKEIEKEIERSSKNAQGDLQKSQESAKNLKEKIQDSREKLKGQKDLSWQDKQKLKDLIKKREELEKQLDDLKQSQKSFFEKRNAFTEDEKRLKEKAEEIQKLMDELMDQDTKKLYEELQKLLEEQANLDKIQDKLKDLENSEDNLEEKLDRTLELFKRLKVDQKIADLKNDLEKLAEEQQKLGNKSDSLARNSKENKEGSEKSEQTDTQNQQQQDKPDNKNQEKAEDLQKNQDSLNQQFENLQNEMRSLEKLNQELNNPKPLSDFKNQEKDIQQEQQKAGEQLKKNNLNKAGEHQKNSGQKMKQMAQKLSQMQSSMEMKMLQENIDNLRNILDNLITLSFDQEELMNNFKEINPNDPRFVELSQNQLKLQEDAQIIEDSLKALAQRVFQLKSFINEEIDNMNQYMDESMEALQDRNQYKAIGKQQFAMSSINNLALMLNDVLQQMQQQMADAMGIPKPQNKPSNNPSISQLQQQLNQQIRQLKRSGKTGRDLSEELAKMAAEQEKIRRKLQELLKKQQAQPGKNPGKGGDDLVEDMQETEKDLVNKNLTREMIERQRKIESRLLEIQKSIRQQKTDDERKSETASDYERKLSRKFEEYLKSKKQEVELLKTVPAELNPFYKNEAREYFKRLEE